MTKPSTSQVITLPPKSQKPVEITPNSSNPELKKRYVVAKDKYVPGFPHRCAAQLEDLKFVTVGTNGNARKRIECIQCKIIYLGKDKIYRTKYKIRFIPMDLLKKRFRFIKPREIGIKETA